MRVETIRIERFGGETLLKAFVLGAAPCMALLLLLTGASTRFSVPPGHEQVRLNRRGGPASAAIPVSRAPQLQIAGRSLERDRLRPPPGGQSAAPSARLLLPLWWGLAGWLSVGSGLWIYSKLCPIEIKAIVPSDGTGM